MEWELLDEDEYKEYLDNPRDCRPIKEINGSYYRLEKNRWNL